MIRSFSKIFSLLLLLTAIAASYTHVFIESESSFFNESIGFVDGNTDNEADDSEFYLPSIQVTYIENLHVIQKDIGQHSVKTSLNLLAAIRAPPFFYL